jgi:hypothetical protein
MLPAPSAPTHATRQPGSATMQITENMIGLTAVIMGSLTVLIPIAGITARIALKQVVEAMARYREMKGSDDAVVMLERRMSLMEEQLHGMDRSLRLLVEDSDFRRRLEMQAPVGAAALGPAPGNTGAGAGTGS